MKITRQQLRRLIEADVIKRGDYVAPVEAPLEDPRKSDFDMSDENKAKLLDLAGSDDDETRSQADNLADTLGFPSSGRFGADTLSKQMKMYDMGLDLLNDPEIDRLVNAGVDHYFNGRRVSFAIDLDDILKTGYKYPEGPGGFQLYLEGDPNWHEKMPEGFDFNDADFMTVDEPHLHIDIIHGIMDQIRFLIQVSFKKDHGSNINTELVKDFFKPEEIENTVLGNKLQSLSNLKKAYNLFKRYSAEERSKIGPAIVQHIYDKAMKPMYEIFTETIQNHNPNQDMSQVKEGKLKVTRRQLSGMIREMKRKINETY
jgi:hypothetical protein